MDLKEIIEAILFNAQKPLSAEEIRNVIIETAKNSENPEAKKFNRIPIESVTGAIKQIEQQMNNGGYSFRLICVAGAWQFASRPEFSPWLRTLYGQRQRPPRLSQPALETIAIIAYRQPVTRAEVEQIRGVSVDGVIQTLLERGLIEQIGKADVPGRPALYSTTQLFLEYFGLKSLDDLPAADELRRIQVQKPESLLTVDNPDLKADNKDDVKKQETEKNDANKMEAPSQENVSSETENNQTPEQSSDTNQ
ncbi:MAG TPA: SMC-Scp complex subunit ScpB [Verrucomicrobiota bacterium]|nr:SMC-Scp complex subunit ScpB [Verrucomicrobiota bacterium]